MPREAKYAAGRLFQLPGVFGGGGDLWGCGACMKQEILEAMHGNDSYLRHRIGDQYRGVAFLLAEGRFSISSLTG